MRFGTECALGGLGAAAVLGILVAALEVSVAAMPATRGVDPASVTRTLKGDRLPSVSDTNRASPVRTGPSASPVQTIHEPKLPDGCVAAAAWRRAHIYTAEIAGRCIG